MDSRNVDMIRLYRWLVVRTLGSSSTPWIIPPFGILGTKNTPLPGRSRNDIIWVWSRLYLPWDDLVRENLCKKPFLVAARGGFLLIHSVSASHRLLKSKTITIHQVLIDGNTMYRGVPLRLIRILQMSKKHSISYFDPIGRTTRFWPEEPFFTILIKWSLRRCFYKPLCQQ